VSTPSGGHELPVVKQDDDHAQIARAYPVLRMLTG
jgi:hypothetical protein